MNKIRTNPGIAALDAIFGLIEGGLSWVTGRGHNGQQSDAFSQLTQWIIKKN
jgi:hypothetical protein